MKIDKEKFAKRFKQCKDITGLTQKEIAAILGVKRSTVGSWESAHRLPQVEKAQGLADIFKVRVGYLIGSEDDPTSPQAPIKKPTPEEQVLSAREIGEAIRISFNLYSEGKIDELTCYKLNKLAEEKFGLPSVKTPDAAYLKEKTSGSGILGDEKNEKNNSGNAEKHGRDIEHKVSVRKSSPKPVRKSQR